ncbi:MAG: hypothetical protein HYY86_01055 [Candidatus Harrisonbacteria bacterium]|nr:hypothetical protein [Candidatus Harrisonbacteria bacterium]
MKTNGQLPIQELEECVKKLQETEDGNYIVWAAIGPDDHFLKDQQGKIIASTSPIDIQSKIEECYPELAKKKTYHLKPLTEEYLERIKTRSIYPRLPH